MSRSIVCNHTYIISINIRHSMELATQILTRNNIMVILVISLFYACTGNCSIKEIHITDEFYKNWATETKKSAENCCNKSDVLALGRRSLMNKLFA